MLAIRPTIRELYEQISGLPDMINIFRKDGSHYWVGTIQEASEEIKNLVYSKAILHYRTDKPQVEFIL